MEKVIKLFYIIDFIIIVISAIGLIVINNSEYYGLAALTNVGYFVIVGLIFIASILLFVIVSIIFIIIFIIKKVKSKQSM